MSETLADIRRRMTAAKTADEGEALRALVAEADIPLGLRREACRDAERLVDEVRGGPGPGAMDALLAEYGLGSPEGVALLRLSEALMRVPDAPTMDALIADKLAPADWRGHRGRSPSALVNAVTLCLELASFCLRGPSGAGPASWPRALLKRAAAPVARLAASRAVRAVAGRFVLGRDIGEALRRSRPAEREGARYSYDMLGEAALTEEEARFHFDAYKGAIEALAPHCRAADHRDSHGVSIKLSALHPRYEQPQRGRVMAELVGRVSALARMARRANMGISVDAEESERLELSLDVVEAVLRDPELAGWDGFGVVVQAYGKAAPHAIDWLYRLAADLDRRICVRLVKGAYWDTEIKRAQVEGLEEFPVYTRKAATDVAYLCCAKKLLGMPDRIYPQFAGHNANTVASVLRLAGEDTPFELQRLHGMGAPLHRLVAARGRARLRIYAPVGEHRGLLPYLARRILENGANSSFVNQISSPALSAAEVAADPFDALERAGERNERAVASPRRLFGEGRLNSRGWDLHSPEALAGIDAARGPHRSAVWGGGPGGGGARPVLSPADPSDRVGAAAFTSDAEIEAALAGAAPWNAAPEERARVLRRASGLYEERAGEAFALLCREAGKTLDDAVAELREAVDFLRYYAAEAERAAGREPLGVVACVSPWNFPLAIFTGQVAGALAAGNGAVAKPAEQTPLTARFAAGLLREAGVPPEALRLVLGDGPGAGARLVSDPRVSGVAFTGSTETARGIEARMAESLSPDARLVAETGGLNAMVVDSTALPEQAVPDIVASSFRSAGQRCSALRVLYLQREIEGPFLETLRGAMDELRVGDPWLASTDVGPLIDAEAKARVEAHVEAARREGRLLKQCAAPARGHFVGPALIRVGGIGDVEGEVFGPVLHVAGFRSGELGAVLGAVRASGYGLTFGMHSRIDARAGEAARRAAAGNVYVNRNQIGAVVGSQPFGGEGLSGTGPKAGGPGYVPAFARSPGPRHPVGGGPAADPAEVQRLLDRAGRGPGPALATEELPGPTGESNRLSRHPRGTVLCLGPRPEDAAAQAEAAASVGCAAVRAAAGAEGEGAVPGVLPREALATLENLDVVALWSDEDDLRAARRALAARSGPLVPLVASLDLAERCVLERHVCIDTAAAGGNAALLAEASAGSGCS